MSFSGTIKSFNSFKGYGFVTYNETDVFAHLNDCQGGIPQPGDVVTFDLEESPSKPGTYKAVKITGGTGQPAPTKGGKGGGKAPMAGTGACKGLVKSYSEQKAWGFLTYEGQDVFFHVKDMVDGSAPVTGDTLQFDLEDNPSKPGSLKAKNVTGGSGWPSMKGGKGGYGKDMGGWGQDYSSWGPYGKGMGGWDGGKGKSWDGGKGWDSGKGWDGGKGKSWDGGKGMGMGWDGGKGMGGWDGGKGMGKSWDGGKGMGGWDGGKGMGKW